MFSTAFCTFATLGAVIVKLPVLKIQKVLDMMILMDKWYQGMNLKILHCEP